MTNTQTNATWMNDFPQSLEVEFRDEIGKKTVDLANKSQEWVLWAIAIGVKQSIADAIAGKAGTEEGKTLILAKYERVCANGEVPSGGGGGAKLSIETAAWITYYKSKGSPVKIKGKQPKRQNLDEYHAIFVKKAIWPSISKQLATMSQDDQRKFHAEKLPALLKKHTQLVLEKAESDPKLVGSFIDAEKRKRSGTKADDFHVDIEI